MARKSGGRRWLVELGAVKQWSPEDARRVLAAWEESGDSLAAFARRHGFVAQRLAWWRKRLGSVSTLAEPMTLVPVTVHESMASTGSAGSAPISLVVSDAGLRVDVLEPARVPAAWLAELLLSASGRPA